MKICTFIFIISVFLFYHCSPQHQPANNTKHSTTSAKTGKIDKIQLTEQTRGTNRIFTFSPGSKITSLNGMISKSILPASDWQDILGEVNTLDLAKIQRYQSTSEGRFSDRALSSEIIIFSEGKIYTSASFDEKVPPAELKGLYDLLKKD